MTKEQSKESRGSWERGRAGRGNEEMKNSLEAEEKEKETKLRHGETR